MREILFRGKVESCEWVYGHYHEALRSLQKNSFIISLGKTHKVIPETVGQFTGLTDKNGNKVFEGDKVKIGWGDKIIGESVVEWKDHSWSFSSLVSIGRMELEIIGNIHEQR